MTDEHAKALNAVLCAGGLRAELAAIVRYAGQYAGKSKRARWEVYEKYHAEGKKVVERAGRPWSAWGKDFSTDLLRALRLSR